MMGYLALLLSCAFGKLANAPLLLRKAEDYAKPCPVREIPEEIMI